MTKIKDPMHAAAYLIVKKQFEVKASELYDKIHALLKEYDCQLYADYDRNICISAYNEDLEAFFEIRLT